MSFQLLYQFACTGRPNLASVVETRGVERVSFPVEVARSQRLEMSLDSGYFRKLLHDLAEQLFFEFCVKGSILATILAICGCLDDGIKGSVSIILRVKESMFVLEVRRVCLL